MSDIDKKPGTPNSGHSEIKRAKVEATPSLFTLSTFIINLQEDFLKLVS